jgi:3-dehydroquinate dehydratase I
MVKICSSIAVDNPSILPSYIQKAFDMGSDFVEIRFDFMNRVDIDRAISLVEPFKKKSIYTLRSATEGGRFIGSEIDRIILLKKLSSCMPMLLDVELNALRSNDDLADFLEDQKSMILVSHHNFNETPSIDYLKAILNEMQIYSNYAKIVTYSKTISDSLSILDLYDELSEMNLIAFAMGDLGIISRILCTIVGNAPFTYAALDESIAPGQVPLAVLRKIYDKIKPTN